MSIFTRKSFIEKRNKGEQKGMATFLFDQLVFGPVKSRRLGISLGINLLPTNQKVCSFDCIYCECGLNAKKNSGNGSMPLRSEVFQTLEAKLAEMHQRHEYPDVITFAGNGEPTLHPEFAHIVNDVLDLRQKYCPGARVAVLSNASRLHRPEVFAALLKVDDNIQKLDAGNAQTIAQIDRPNYPFSLDEVVAQLQKFNGKVTIQTMFIQGSHLGVSVDNSTDAHLHPWLELLRQIKPRLVMIYTIERDTPIPTLQKVSKKRLDEIALQVRRVVDQVIVSG